MQLIFGGLVSLITWLSGLGTWFLFIWGEFVVWLGRKYAVWLAVVSSMLALVVLLIASIHSILVSLSSFLTPPAWLLVFLNVMSPPHLVTLLSIAISARACRSAYDFSMEKLRLLNNG